MINVHMTINEMKNLSKKDRNLFTDANKNYCIVLTDVEKYLTEMFNNQYAMIPGYGVFKMENISFDRCGLTDGLVPEVSHYRMDYIEKGFVPLGELQYKEWMEDPYENPDGEERSLYVRIHNNGTFDFHEAVECISDDVFAKETIYYTWGKQFPGMNVILKDTYDLYSRQYQYECKSHLTDSVVTFSGKEVHVGDKVIFYASGMMNDGIIQKIDEYGNVQIKSCHIKRFLDGSEYYDTYTCVAKTDVY